MPVCILVGSASALIKRRAIVHKYRHAIGQCAGQKSCGRKTGYQTVEVRDKLVLRQVRHDLAVARHKHAHVQGQGAQRGGQRTADICQAACFDQRCDF